MSPLTIVPPAVRCLWRRAGLRHALGVCLLVGVFWTAGLVLGLGTGEAQAAEDVNVAGIASPSVTAVQETAVDVRRSVDTAEAAPPEDADGTVNSQAAGAPSPVRPEVVSPEPASPESVRPEPAPRSGPEAAGSVRRAGGAAVSHAARAAAEGEAVAQVRHTVERVVSGPPPEAPPVVAPVTRSLERLPGVVEGTVGALPLVPAVELPQAPGSPGGQLPGGGTEKPQAPSGPGEDAGPDGPGSRTGQLPGAGTGSPDFGFTTADGDGSQVRPGSGHHAPPAPRLPHPAANSSSGDAGSSRTGGDSAGAFFHSAVPGTGAFGPDGAYDAYPTRERHREIPEFPG